MITAFSTVVEQRDAADRAQGGRGEPAAAAAHQPLRADDRLDREPERHGALRGRHRAVPGAVLRRRARARAAGCSCSSICILAGIGTAGVPGGSIPVIAVILGMVGVPVEGLGLDPRRRPLPRHVPHGAQRQRRPRRRGRRVARRAREKPRGAARASEDGDTSEATALVTGANRGIGLETSRRLAQLGPAGPSDRARARRARGKRTKLASEGVGRRRRGARRRVRATPPRTSRSARADRASASTCW